MKGLLTEFRDFILKGNMLYMAVGIVIGAAFSTLVKSLVDNVIMPPIGLLMGGVDFADKIWTLQAAEVGADGEVVKEAVTINYGQFINDIIALVIVGFCIFMLVKFYNESKKKFEKKQEEAPEATDPPIGNEEKLLTEIRDLLAKQQGPN